MRSPLLSLALAGAAFAQDQVYTAANCVNVSFDGTKLLNPGTPVTGVVPVDLPAGTVEIPNAVSVDSYPERVNVSQPSEIWEVEFLGAGDVVLADIAGLVEAGVTHLTFADPDFMNGPGTSTNG